MALFEGFEPSPRGFLPARLLATHPDGRHAALQIARWSESAIWEQESKRIVWAPRHAVALSWLKQGTQVAGLFEPHDSTFEFALFSWPDKQELHRCPVAISGGWDRFFDFWIAPPETFALFRFWDQTEFGFEWVDITLQGIQQDVSAGFFFEGTNNVSQPAFSPSGQRWACAYLDDLWWATDPEDPDPDQPAPGGEYTMGALLIFEEKKRPPRRIPLVATFPPGWLPKDLLDPVAFMIEIADPLFLDEQRVQIQLPTGEVEIHQL